MHPELTQQGGSSARTPGPASPPGPSSLARPSPGSEHSGLDTLPRRIRSLPWAAPFVKGRSHLCQLLGRTYLGGAVEG